MVLKYQQEILLIELTGIYNKKWFLISVLWKNSWYIWAGKFQSKDRPCNHA